MGCEEPLPELSGAVSDVCLSAVFRTTAFSPATADSSAGESVSPKAAPSDATRAPAPSAAQPEQSALAALALLDGVFSRRNGLARELRRSERDFVRSLGELCACLEAAVRLAEPEELEEPNGSVRNGCTRIGRGTHLAPRPILSSILSSSTAEKGAQLGAEALAAGAQRGLMPRAVCGRSDEAMSPAKALPLTQRAEGLRTLLAAALHLHRFHGRLLFKLVQVSARRCARTRSALRPFERMHTYPHTRTTTTTTTNVSTALPLYT